MSRLIMHALTCTKEKVCLPLNASQSAPNMSIFFFATMLQFSCFVGDDHDDDDGEANMYGDIEGLGLSLIQ